MPGDFGIEWSTYQLERHRQFFHVVDERLGAILAADPQPVLVVGVPRYLSLFAETSRHMDSVTGTLTGSHDKTTAHELARLVWPTVQEALHKQRLALLDELALATGAQRSASGMAEVWPLAHEGRGDTLLVEEGFRYPARLDPTGRFLVPADDPTAPDVLDDAVDDLVATVLAKRGRVVFVDPGALTQQQRVAMVLRY
jgi:Bacterial archaeo-eukaryotic release factor family 3